MNLEMHSSSLQDRFARKIAARLSDGSSDLGHDIGERLRVGRQQALARRKMVQVGVATATTAAGGRGATLQLGGGEPGLWGRLASALPVLALVAGLLTIYMVQNEDRANEVAEVDAALLTDTLPTAAYTDPGFIQFLKTSTTPAPQE